MSTKKRKVPIKLTIAFDDADKAYQKGKNTKEEPKLLKKLLDAQRAVERAQEGPYNHRKERPSTAGQRREASRRFGRQEETVEHAGRLQRIPGSVVGPNERHKRVTQKDKQKAADLTELGLEIASYTIGAGKMVGLIAGAAKFLTGAAKALFVKGGENALKSAASQAAIKRANAAARKAAKNKVKKTPKKTPKKTSKKTPKIVKTSSPSPKKPVSEAQRKLADEAQRSSQRQAAAAAAAAAAAKKKAAAAAKKKAAAAAKTKPTVASKVKTSAANIAAVARGKGVKTPPGGSGMAVRNPKTGQLRSATKAQQRAGKTISTVAPAAPVIALGTALVVEELNRKAAEKEAAQKELNLQKDIDAATAKRDAKTKIAKAEKKASALEKEREGPEARGRIAKAERAKERIKERETKQADDITAAQKVRSAVDKMSAAERKSLGPVTNFMEELLGLNRDKAQIEKDLKVTEELESRDRGGMKRGGRAKKPSVSRKTYAMNRGGKVAPVRKPNRA